MTITRSDQNKEDKTMSEREKNEKSTVRPMKRTRKKVCAFCADRAEFIDYKDVAKLRKCMTERYKILPRRVTSERAYNSYQEGKTGSSYSLRF
jgi:small subunit ribosomal protein S18